MGDAEPRNNHPEGLTQVQEALCDELFEIGAVKFGEFKLKLHDKYPDAPLSPVYIDLRVLRRFPEAKMAAVDVYEELVQPLNFDLLADIPTAATPIVSSLSDKLNIGMITPREAKTHGSGAKVDGLTAGDKGKTALMIDDLVTRAISATEAAEVLREQDLVVNDLVVLIDREQGGKAQLESVGIALHYALTMAQMIQYYKRVEKIPEAEYERIQKSLQEMADYSVANNL